MFLFVGRWVKKKKKKKMNMNNVLDSPLEALAVNYLSFGFLTAVNKIWTWVAVITAAVSLWRIKASGGPTSDPDELPPPDTAALNSEPPSTSTESVAVASAPAVCAVETTEAVTRGKFTVYYEDDSVVDEGGDGDFGEVGCGGGENLCDGWKWKWEKEMKMRMGNEMGWYHYQDLTVLDGNVVRLWDGCKGRSSNNDINISFSQVVSQLVLCSDS
ncbi:unnamed protein product [Camellia sinensis]